MSRETDFEKIRGRKFIRECFSGSAFRGMSATEWAKRNQVVVAI